MPKIRRDDLENLFDHSIYVPTRTIILRSHIDEKAADLFLKGMAVLSTSSEPIHITMNCEGGDVYHGLAIYDAIHTSKSHVTVTAFGHCMSMGSLILQAADERLLSPTSTLMLHYGYDALDGESATVRRWAHEADRLADLMELIYLRRIREAKPKFSSANLKAILDRDTFLTPPRAVEMGLADRILA